MAALPETFNVRADMAPDSHVTARIEGLPEVEVAPPASFGGPGDRITPEDLLVAAVASCFLLSFKAVARASKLEWRRVAVSVSGMLDKVERTTLFTRFDTRVELELADPSQRDAAQRVVEKSEQICFVTNSLKSEHRLQADIR